MRNIKRSDRKKRLVSPLMWPLLIVALAVFASCHAKTTNSQGQGSAAMDKQWKVLTPAEERVIVHKGTEMPFSGEYVSQKADGVYECRRCGQALFDSAAKFDSQSGWPSFDDAIAGAVKEITDADGIRTELVCANCGAHLGHVFRGEQFTDKNTRHCVNSASLDFEPAQTAPAAGGLQEAYFAGGCFWGVEYHFENLPGVIKAESGYMGGKIDDPSYGAVCTGSTGHAEAVRVTFDPAKVGYEKLARLFFEIHDPTQVDRQGPDIGDQYRSAVFFTDPEQQQTAEKLIGLLRAKGLKVATALAPADTFFPAEDYHQDYYAKKRQEPYCHIYTKRFD